MSVSASSSNFQHLPLLVALLLPSGWLSSNCCDILLNHCFKGSYWLHPVLHWNFWKCEELQLCWSSAAPGSDLHQLHQNWGWILRHPVQAVIHHISWPIRCWYLCHQRWQLCLYWRLHHDPRSHSWWYSEDPHSSRHLCSPVCDLWNCLWSWGWCHSSGSRQ